MAGLKQEIIGPIAFLFSSLFRFTRNKPIDFKELQVFKIQNE
jgi:hypothetical protein